MGPVQRRRSKPDNLKDLRVCVENLTAQYNPIDDLHVKLVGVGHRQSRKELRKRKRKLKKMRMHAFKQNKPLPTAESLESEHKMKLKQLREKKRKLQEKKIIKQRNHVEKMKLNEDSARKEADWLSSKQKDERLLKQLEKNLKIKKGKKSLPSAFLTDGLDYILDVVEPDKVKSLISADCLLKELDSSSAQGGYLSEHRQPQNNSEDMEVVETEDELSDSQLADPFFKSVDDDEDASSCDNNNEKLELEVHRNNKAGFSKAEPKVKRLQTLKHCIGESLSTDVKLDFKSRIRKKVQFLTPVSLGEDIDSSIENVAHEDIYGRLKDGHSSVVQLLSPAGATYVPPGKRQIQTESRIDEDGRKSHLDIMLMRQLKGQINRLSESNLQSVGNNIESMYCKYSRAEMTNALTDVILEACLLPSLTPVRVTSDVALLLALLHHRVGSQVSFTVLRVLTTRYQHMFEELATNVDTGKQIENALALLCWLYSFKVISCQLILDLANQLIGRLCGRDIELLLVLLKATGFGLRKDSPDEFKKFMCTIQVKAGVRASDKDYHHKSRVKFLLDTLVGIRSNSDLKLLCLEEKQHLQHLHKLLNLYCKGSYECELRLTLKDVLNAAQDGRWFITGAAWRGSKLLEGENQPNDESSAVMSSFGDKLARKARLMGMNTELRRTIFNILATCDNYVDAFEKLVQLAAQQQHQRQREMVYRELVYVVSQLCLHEGPPSSLGCEDVSNSINMFYIFLLDRLCQSHCKGHVQIAVKFTVRNQIQLIAETEPEPSKLTRLADVTYHLISRSIIGLAVLKDVDFMNISKPMHRFLKRLLSNLLSQLSDISVETVFRQIVDKPLLLSKQIHLYLKLFFKRETIDEVISRRIKLAERAMTPVA